MAANMNLRLAGCRKLVLAGSMVFAVLCVTGTAGFPADEVPKTDASKPETLSAETIAALVRQLGHDAYVQRQQAAERLKRQGIAAREALLGGLRDPDLEVRRGCRRLLAEVLESDFRRRLEALAADANGSQKHDLPCWPRFCEVYGKDKAARELFVQMQRAEPALLESAAAGDELAAQAFRLRFQQVVQMLFGGDGREQRQASLPSIAALLFIAVDSNLQLPQDVAGNHMWTSLFYQQPFQQSLRDGDNKAVVRRMLGRWIQQPTGQTMLLPKLQFAVQYQLKEGLSPALELLKDRKTPNGHMLACAVEGVARLGGKPYAALLAPLLAENRECMRSTMTINGKPEVRVVEIRDIALAWLIELTGQDHGGYDMPEAKQSFENLRRYPQQSFNFYAMGFRDASKREAALKKMEAWLKTARLPDPPPLAAAAPVPPIRNPNVPPGAAAAPAVIGVQAGADQQNKERTESAPLAGLAMADRLKVQKLNEARKLIEQESYALAVGILGEILAADSDFAFRPDRAMPVYRRLKAEAERLLAALPARGRAEYELQFGAVARQRLAEAVASGNPERLPATVQNFFFAEAGAEAAFLLGTHYRTVGEFLRGAFYLRRLQQDADRGMRFEPALSVELAACYLHAGMPQVAQEILLACKSRNPEGEVVLGGERRRLFETPEQALGWLEQYVGRAPQRPSDWTIFGGNPGHNGSVADSHPLLKPTYRSPAEADELLRETIEKNGKRHRDARTAAVPSVHPLVVGDTVLYRTATEVRAVDLASGSLRWQAPLEDPLQYFLQFAPAERKKSAAETVARGVARRLWQDLSFGTMSSDGRLVFGLENMPFNLGANNQSMVILPNGRRQLDPGVLKTYNTLTAYDVATGKIRWEVGGPPVADGSKLAGAYFLGPPLPLDDQLYVVADLPGQTQLLALQPSSGDVLYEWLLSVQDEEPPPLGVMIPVNRAERFARVGGASPSYADGILVCSTSDNRTVAVELTTRSILWAFEGPRKAVGARNVFAARQIQQADDADRPDRWSDFGATIAEGRVLLCPQGADQLICLRLTDGNQEWSIPRGDGLYVGGVRDGKAIVVGRKSVRAIRLADGTPAWPAETSLPPLSVPSGRGLLGKTFYYVPLATADVIAIDLATGRIAARSRSAEGLVPGNLVFCQGAVLSQNADGLCRFDLLAGRDGQLETALRNRTDDAPLLAERGEVLLYQGRRAEAVDHLRRSLKLQPAERTRQLLSEALCEALHYDFDKFRPLVDELDPLFDTPELRGRLLKELAFGLRRTGRSREAFDAYMKWIEILPDAKKLEPVDAARTVRIDRLIQSELADLRAAAKPEDREEIDKGIAKRFRDDPPEKFLAFFGFHPHGDEVRLRLVEKLGKEKRISSTSLAQLLRAAGRTPERRRWLEMEMLLRRVQTRGTAEQQQTAAARLTQLLAEAGRAAAAPADPWPPGEITKDAGKADANRPQAFSQRFPIWTPAMDRQFHVAFESPAATLTETGPDGRTRWKLSLEPAKINPRFTGYVQQYSEGRMEGHLMVALLGNCVCAVDTLAASGAVLWAQESPSATRSDGGNVQIVRRRFQVQRQAKPLATPVPTPLAVSTEYVCFEQDRKLVAVEPLTGQVLWTRDDIPADSDLAGDDEMIWVTPPDSSEATVLAASDGRELGRRPAPPLSKRIAAFGRRFLAWDVDGKQAHLKLVDAWTQQEIWRRDFTDSARFWLVDSREIGVLEPDGSFCMVSLADGRNVFKSQTEPLKTLDGIVVRRSAGRYVLITGSPKPEQNPFGEQNLPGSVSVGGWAYGFDAATGKQIWAAELPNQMFNIHQSRDLPILVFLRRFMKATPLPNGGVSYGSTMSHLLILDSRTGRKLHDESTQGYDEQFRIESDPEAKRLEVRTQVHSVKFSVGGGNAKVR